MSTRSNSCIISVYNCWLITINRSSHCYRCLLAVKFVFLTQKQDIRDENWELSLSIVKRVFSFHFNSQIWEDHEWWFVEFVFQLSCYKTNWENMIKRVCAWYRMHVVRHHWYSIIRRIRQRRTCTIRQRSH